MISWNGLSYSPLPRLKDLFLVNIANSNNDIAQIWMEGNEIGYWFSRSSWSLYSIAKYRMQLLESDTGRVLPTIGMIFDF